MLKTLNIAQSFCIVCLSIHMNYRISGGCNVIRLVFAGCRLWLFSCQAVSSFLLLFVAFKSLFEFYFVCPMPPAPIFSHTVCVNASDKRDSCGRKWTSMRKRVKMWPNKYQNNRKFKIFIFAFLFFCCCWCHTLPFRLGFILLDENREYIWNMNWNINEACRTLHLSETQSNDEVQFGKSMEMAIHLHFILNWDI